MRLVSESVFWRYPQKEVGYSLSQEFSFWNGFPHFPLKIVCSCSNNDDDYKDYVMRCDEDGHDDDDMIIIQKQC